MVKTVRHPPARIRGDVSRRTVLTGTAAFALLPSLVTRSEARLADTPFTLGVASGDPDARSVVLWTRLMLPVEEPPAGRIDVRWSVFADEALLRPVRHGTASADPDNAHAVHVVVDGLEPDRFYWYRFEALGHRSPVGRTRTFPHREAPAGRARFAVASCQHYEHGHFAAHRLIAEERNDFVVFVGDYIYERGGGSPNPVRRHNASIPTTLDEYRARYALYKSDPLLQASHASAPWLVIWDDHEVENDYANAQSQHLHPRAFFLKRRADAYRAFYEHMPLRPAARPRGSDLDLYRHLEYGALATLFMLDCRQYRSPQACNPSHRGGSRSVAPCPELTAERRTMLGARQERWLAGRLRASRSAWNLLVQTTIVAKIDRDSGKGPRFSNDPWDGYPAARRRLLTQVGPGGARNSVFLGGDIHAFAAAELKRDFDDPRAPAVATEFVASSVTAFRARADEPAAWRPKNPHLLFAEGRRRGYLRCTLDARQLQVDMRAVKDVRDPNSAGESIASFQVAAGTPRIQALKR
ncbi:MAG: alkaline phosphatase D family protein [Hyphomicrobiaceae bacterium]|nr:alkaline phosphatase D family protein [Hyphomicrobiaceae bacterium]